MSETGPLRIAVVCEDAPDQATACSLADRAVCEGVDWIEADVLPSLREWRGKDMHRSFLAWKHVRTVAEELHVSAHGHFSGQPGAPDARIGRLALLVVGLLHPDLAAVLLIRDADKCAERRIGLNQARESGQRPFEVIIGLAVTKRECWLLAAFEPSDKAENKRLTKLKKELGFDPRAESARLSAGDEHAKRSAKRVLRELCNGDSDRAAQAIGLTATDTLKERGRENGLAEYLHELDDRLVPLFRSMKRSGPRAG